MPEFFQSSSSVKQWKVDYNVLTSSFYGGTAFGYSSIILGINQLPANGFCSISPTSGITGNTTFFIKCTDWVDPDGFIARIEYYSKY